jgi:hypothetical protein
MRVLVAIAVLLASAAAHADPAEVRIGRVAMAGGAVAELYEVADGVGFAQWTIVIDDHGTVTRSPTLELVRSNCGMHKCVLGAARRPKLHTIRGGTAVEIELFTRFVFESTNPDTGRSRIGERWHDYDAIECTTDTCVTRHRTGRRPLD